jgi:hypothetical protein
MVAVAAACSGVVGCVTVSAEPAQQRAEQGPLGSADRFTAFPQDAAGMWIADASDPEDRAPIGWLTLLPDGRFVFGSFEVGEEHGAPRPMEGRFGRHRIEDGEVVLMSSWPDNNWRARAVVIRHDEAEQPLLSMVDAEGSLWLFAEYKPFDENGFEAWAIEWDQRIEEETRRRD